MITIRPALLKGIEVNKLAECRELEEALIDYHSNKEKDNLKEEMLEAMQIMRGMLYPSGTAARDMAEAMLADQKKLNGLPANEPIKISDSKYDEITEIEFYFGKNIKE